MAFWKTRDMSASATPRPRRLSRALIFEMVRFGLMGATSAGIYFIFFIPLNLCLPGRLWLTSSTAYLLSMVANYVLQRNYTFRSKRPHQEAVARFLVVQLAGLALNSGVLELLHGREHWSLWPAQAVAIVGVALWSYVAQKIWVFVGKRRQVDG